MKMICVNWLGGMKFKKEKVDCKVEMLSCAWCNSPGMLCNCMWGFSVRCSHRDEMFGLNCQLDNKHDKTPEEAVDRWNRQQIYLHDVRNPQTIRIGRQLTLEECGVFQ